MTGDLVVVAPEITTLCKTARMDGWEFVRNGEGEQLVSQMRWFYTVRIACTLYKFYGMP